MPLPKTSEKGSERNAVGFTNYVRSVYGESELRTSYGSKFPDLNFSSSPNFYNRSGERVSDYTELGFHESTDGQLFMGVRYTSSDSNTQGQTQYQIGWIGTDGMFNFKQYDNHQDYSNEWNRILEL